MTDRPDGLPLARRPLNVRRLMYQPLIWPTVAGDDAGGLRPALNPKRMEGAADALVYGVRRDMELGGDFLGGKMLIDQQQTVELAARES